MSEPDTLQSGAKERPAKEAGGGVRLFGDLRQGLGTSGALFGTSGGGARTFLFGAAAMATTVGAVNIINVLTVRHERPDLGLMAPAVWEGSSWVTFLLFVWIPWLAFRAAPPKWPPGWRAILIHPFAALAFSFCHVGGFVLLREAVYALNGETYQYGAFGPHFLYELGKDVFGYALAIASFAVASLIVARERPGAVPSRENLYSIRDGARILRVKVAEILAIGSAGNYVEFVLGDGRKALMRSPLSAIEAEFEPHGFLRVHRSWLVNPARMTGLKPEGSGDYTVELGDLEVPLSRRFPEALAKLKAA
jgi:LytTr DNA-binding domain